MDVRLAVLADYSNISIEGKLNILGIFNEIRAENFPAKHPKMQLIMTLEAHPAEAGQDKSVQVKLMDENGGTLFDATENFKVPKPAEPGVPVKARRILDLYNATFPKPGSYEFCILIDGRTTTIPLKLVKIKRRQ